MTITITMKMIDEGKNLHDVNYITIGIGIPHYNLYAINR